MDPNSDDTQPYQTFRHILNVHFHSDVYDQRQIDDLRTFYAHPTVEQPAWVRQFKKELADALSDKVDGIEEDEVFDLTNHAHETDREFLEIIWSKLFPDESIPGSTTHEGSRLEEDLG